MKYSDLLALKLELYDFEGCLKLLQGLGVSAPISVIKQFYIDHYENYDFQKYYGHLDLLALKWELVEMPTSKLMLARFHATYPEIVDEVSTVASIYDEVGDFAISEDPLVLEYWKKHGTWTVPPIFLHGNLLGESQDIIHLVEGHTRLGCLIGAYEYGIIDVAPTHKIFIGSIEKHT